MTTIVHLPENVLQLLSPNSRKSATSIVHTPEYVQRLLTTINLEKAVPLSPPRTRNVRLLASQSRKALPPYEAHAPELYCSYRPQNPDYAPHPYHRLHLPTPTPFTHSPWFRSASTPRTSKRQHLPLRLLAGFHPFAHGLPIDTAHTPQIGCLYSY